MRKTTHAPVLNINGTSPEALLDGIKKALDALYQASWEVGQTAPHPRDWQTVDDSGFSFRAAQAAHDRRLVALQTVRDELEAIGLDIDEQADQRRRA